MWAGRAPSAEPDHRRRMRHLHLTWLAPGTLAAAIALVTLGAIVRVSGAGEGCPDWPLCFGQIIPPPRPLAWIEFAHRLGAVLVSILVVVLPLVAWRDRRRDSRALVLAVSAPGILLMQILLGGLTVLSKLAALVIAAHLRVSLLLVAVLSALAVHVRAHDLRPRAEIGAHAGVTITLVVALCATFLLLVPGAWVVGSGASLACMDWPLCAAAIVPVGQGSQRLLQGLHRLTAAATIACLTVLIFRVRGLRHGWPAGWRFTWLAFGLVVAQALLGGMLVLAQLPTWMRAAHVLLATLVWAILIALMSTWLGRQSLPALSPKEAA
jgi:heme A synthase